MPTVSPAVLLVAENGHSGGIGRYCVDLAGALGDRVRLVCLCPAPCPEPNGCWLSAQCVSRGIQLHRVAMPPRGWRAGFSGLVKLWKLSTRPVIHVNGRRGNSIAAAARGLVPGFRYVTTVHGVLGLHARRNAVYRLVDLAACRGAAAVIAVSDDTRSRLLRTGSPSARTVTIPNGLAPDEVEALGRVADARPDAGTAGAPLRIGFLGRLSPEKGTRDVLALSRRLHDSGAAAHFAIAGDGPDRAWLTTELRPLIESGFVSYSPSVAATTFLSEVDVVVMPSRNEGMPYVLLEAMAAGCAVVAYRVGGIPEVVSDGSLGVLVPPADPEGFRDRARPSLRQSTRSGRDRPSCLAACPPALCPCGSPADDLARIRNCPCIRTSQPRWPR